MNCKRKSAVQIGKKPPCANIMFWQPSNSGMRWLHTCWNQKHRQESEMRKVHGNAIITGLAFVIIALADVAESPASAGPIVPPGHYCMTWDIGGSDCSFTSYDQCLATAAGLDAECYGKTARDDREDSTIPST